MTLKSVLYVTTYIVMLITWTMTYFTNSELIKQNEKLYKQVTACHEWLDKP